MYNRKYKLKNNGDGHQRVGPVTQLEVRDFDLENDREWFCDQLQADLKLCIGSQPQCFVDEVLLPFNLEQFIEDPSIILMKVIDDHL